ncbi:MAG: aminomethyl-transferring glycine dehydrogenase subunit GcvPB [Candidatus Dormibacteria bacterium]
MSPEIAWAGAEPLVFELGHEYSTGPRVSEDDQHALRHLDALLPGEALRTEAALIPAIPEPVLARHLGRLARRNHHLHHDIYPLGSCTMKHNPAVNEQLAGLEGFAGLHPWQDEEDVQGALRLMWDLESLLARITGMDRFSMQPAAGAHGEWTGLRMVQAYHGRRGDEDRTSVLIPDSEHGPNPASAGLCGLDVVTVGSRPDGTVDLASLAGHLNSRVAAIMLTNPNTLGVFETDILEIAEMAHSAGALLYYDGANLNALAGVARPGDMGFDVVHLNLHKTFSTPHGGGGPGAGPVGVVDHLAPFLPLPTVECERGRYRLDHDRPHSIGKVRSYFGNFGMLVRAYAYIRTYGSTLPRIAEDAVLNARYLQAQLRGVFAMAVESPSLHEFVATTRGCAVEGLRAVDVAKRLIDHGMHPPTMYFPTTVPEALMFEPTETESKQSLDSLAAACAAIMEEAGRDLETVRSAPHNAPVARVDEVGAARHPVVRWTP